MLAQIDTHSVRSDFRSSEHHDHQPQMMPSLLKDLLIEQLKLRFYIRIQDDHIFVDWSVISSSKSACLDSLICLQYASIMTCSLSHHALKRGLYTVQNCVFPNSFPNIWGFFSCLLVIIPLILYKNPISCIYSATSQFSNAIAVDGMHACQ